MSPHKETEDGSKAVDLSHHLNSKSNARHPSPLKDIIKFMSIEGMVSLAGGLPHPSLFPIHKAIITASNPLNDGTSELDLSNDKNEISLADFLQYGTGSGNPKLRKWCHEFTELVHLPLYDNFEILLHPGNTNAWSKVVGLLCEDGDHILCESYTYPSSQAYWIPLGNIAAPVAVDEQGIRDDALQQVLKNWDFDHPGIDRPHVLYLVSVGSNPTGATMGPERRQRIYDICVQYDIIIVEDDPYFFLQYPEYSIETTAKSTVTPNAEFLSSLAPSFLRYDYQGRVIRLESFSKTISPGLRLGYFVANPMFTERLLRATEVETQDPSGLSQVVTLGLLQQWGLDGYLLWLQNLRIEYQNRRDWIIKAIAQHFTLKPAAQVTEVLTDEGLVALIGSVPIFSFVPPTGGMFIWACFYLGNNPMFQKMQSDSTIEDPEQCFAQQLWESLAEELVLLTPGSYYHPWQGKDKVTTKARGASPETANFRLSFSMTTKEDMEVGIARLASVVKSSWKL
ncbi:unnamed protein product [Penicillium glandicola]